MRRRTVVLTLLLLVSLALARESFAELPPLIPRDVLMGNPSRTELRISPDGTRLAYLAPSEGNVMNIWVQTLGLDDGQMITRDTLRGIFAYDWAHDNVHLIYIQDRQGDENWHVYVINMETGELRNLTPFEGVRAENLITDRNHPHEILVGLNKRDPQSFDMHRVNLVSGEVTLEAQNPGDVSDWATDSEFRIRAATALDSETNDTILRIRDEVSGEWRDLVRWSFEETGSVLYKKIIGFAPDGSGLYVQSPMGSEMTRLVLLDVESGEEIGELASDSRSDLWNIWWNPQVMVNPKTHEPEAVGFNYLKPRWEVLDPALQKDFTLFANLGDGVFLVVSRDHPDRRWIVEHYADTQPPRYYLYDRENGSLKQLFDTVPELADYTLAPTEPTVITARDGMKIPCYVTLPVGLAPRDLPTVLCPHGGPWAEDQWGFDPWVQLFANRGYAVLQVNFRGSTGYGKNHLNAGNGEWGVGAMQHDLTDAVRWAIEEGIADPKRVGIVGGSYGGYATLAGLAFTPELYACGVDMVGPSNVRTLFESFPPYWSVRKKRWIRRVGDVEADEELNRRISPLFHAQNIRAPLLIAHGSNDPRVKQSESEAIVDVMRKNNLAVSFVVYPDEGHGLAREENNLDFMGRVEEFLAENLGGRKEPWRQIEGTSAQVR
ncbi:MAG: S9 family peptidase [Candidatus Eiseniibacteriota bacterium]|nr:MAG: S9 family peptidase [Candidatus Eisenbacteria bacterium]